ncbi:hypothetical protein D9Q98_004157 [Chlorella vulgaris]|uniref:Uncharacterized protein n=1 Tax=Chlorella vulgaris TaxID=3077 RepID=A0A9D4YY46_CHLVU|nr:hypothetical protein D9Q98_004157 [Chlorella vulgaris]
MQVGYASSAQAQASIAYGESDLISAAEAVIARADVTIARADTYFAAIAEQDRRLQSEAAVFRVRAYPLPPSQAQVDNYDLDAFWAEEALRARVRLVDENSLACRGLIVERILEDAYLIALRWQAAAAAWRASFELLEYAKRVDPQGPVVRQTEQSILDMHNFKQQCQQWGEAS